MEDIKMGIINIILNIILFMIIGQLATIAHEFGHAIPALIFSKDKVKIILGIEGSRTRSISVGRLDIELRETNVRSCSKEGILIV
jgi:hypothetical protein